MKTKESGFESDVFMNRIFIRNNKLGTDACEILAKVVESIDAYDCVYENIHLDGDKLHIGNKLIHINDFDRGFLIGFGKAAVQMAKAVLDKLGTFLITASVITKDNKFQAEQKNYDNLTVYLGGHPIPTTASVTGTQAIMKDLPPLTARDLVFVVISGGGSALFMDPVESVRLDELQQMTQVLLNCGADINEINTLRKHLDRVKGGHLAERLKPAFVESLILSDVIGDPLDMIASGPTVEDPTTFDDALSILKKYQIKEKIPKSILTVLQNGCEGKIQETPKPGQLPSDRVHNHLVGTNFIAAEAARCQATALGYNTVIVSTHLTGLTEHLANFIRSILQTQLAHNHPIDKPACLIFGGEPTVNVIGDGLGGRNLDLTLRMVIKIAEMQNVLFVSFATDGDDGPTDAAGAVTDGFVFRDGKDLYGLDVHSFISNNDSYHYFEKVGGLIKTGATGSNVNDVIFLLIDEQTQSHIQ